MITPVLDALSAHVAILDKEGRILETNKAWKQFAGANDMQMRPETMDVNYLEVCQSAIGDASEKADDVYKGIKDLIDKKIDEFVMEYPCHSPDEKRWFYMRATRLEEKKEILILVSHENITPLKLAEEKLKNQERILKNREQDLVIQTENLKNTNTALKVLLEQREKDKKDVEDLFVSNIRELIFPYLNKFEESPLNKRQAAWLNIIKTNLQDVISPFLKKLSSLHIQLTPQEVQIAVLVKEGHRTKDIAHILGCSVDAVEFHRKNMRKKLGLTHKKINLRVYLLSLI